MTLSLLSERWLRHAGQLARNRDLFDKSCAIGSIFFALTGALGVILLSIFDTKHHQHLHYGFLGMFMYDRSLLFATEQTLINPQCKLRSLCHFGLSRIHPHGSMVPPPSANPACQLLSQSCIHHLRAWCRNRIRSVLEIQLEREQECRRRSGMGYVIAVSMPWDHNKS